MIQALIFDMDGTIVDNMGVHTAVWLELLSEYGLESFIDLFDGRSLLSSLIHQLGSPAELSF